MRQILSEPCPAAGFLPGAGWEWCNLIQTTFARTSGIKVNLRLKGLGEALAQLIAERANPKTDVWFGGTAYTLVATLVQMMGEEKAFDCMKALHKTISQYTRLGTGPIKLAWVALPWYLPQNLGLWASLAGVWGGAETASGAWQVLRHSRAWLALDAPGLAAAAVAWCLPAGSRQGRWLVVGAGMALAGLLASAFGIGAQGGSSPALTALWGALSQCQPGLGLGGGLALLVLLVLLGLGLARLGNFKRDGFVAAAVVVVVSAALLALFVMLSVLKSLMAAWRV